MPVDPQSALLELIVFLLGIIFGIVFALYSR